MAGDDLIQKTKQLPLFIYISKRLQVLNTQGYRETNLDNNYEIMKLTLGDNLKYFKIRN